MRPNLALHTAVFLLAFANVAVGNPTFRYTLKVHGTAKPTDSITAIEEKKRTVFLVTDSSGIGSGTIALPSSAWPKNAVLRFRYEKGRGFQRLEGFIITTLGLEARGGMHDSGKTSFYFLNADGKHDPGAPPAGELNILVEERNHAMEVTLPSNLFVGAKEVKLSWIDAYR